MFNSVNTARFSAALGAILLLATSQFAEAQNAALQARARMLQRHRQTGSIGNGYRPWSAWTYQNSARSHAQALNAYGQNCKQLPPATAKEHLDETRRNVAATKTEIAKLGDEAAKDADVKEHVDTLTKHLAECERICGMMEKTIGKEVVETAEMCTHCSGLEKQLKAAEAEHRALLKKLGLEPPVPAADHAEHKKAEPSGTNNN